jgi:hypothetical protein
MLSCEHEQVSPSESFQKYFANVNEIFFDTWIEYLVTWKNILPCVMDEKYFWIKWMINKMDELL